MVNCIFFGNKKNVLEIINYSAEEFLLTWRWQIHRLRWPRCHGYTYFPELEKERLRSKGLRYHACCALKGQRRWACCCELSRRGCKECWLRNYGTIPNAARSEALKSEGGIFASARKGTLMCEVSTIIPYVQYSFNKKQSYWSYLPRHANVWQCNWSH